MAYNDKYWVDKSARAKIAKEHTKQMQEKYADEINECVERSRIYDNSNTSLKVSENIPTVIVDDIDSVGAIFKYGNKKTCVLNFSSYKNPGGMFIKGSKAQEECLCRRSNLYPVLKSFVYPLPKISTIYTPGISVIKDNKYNLYGIPYKVNVLSAAMCKLHEGDVFTKEHCLLAKQKIEHLLKTALHFNQRKLVLGAWGCGAYHCPPDTIAKIFKIVLDDPMFKNQFEEICFAILDWQGKNYQAFSKVFK